MRNKGIISVIGIGFLLVVTILISSLMRNFSRPLPEEITTGEILTAGTSRSNMSTTETDHQGGTPADTLTAVQTEPVTNVTSAVATATFPSSQNGAVSVVTDKGGYTVGETIVVTVTNNLDIPITTVNQQSFCSIIRMESQNDGNWQEVKNCYSGEPVSEVTISPGEKAVQQLQAFASGIYRVGLIYSEGDAYDIGKLFAVFTLPFNVKL